MAIRIADTATVDPRAELDDEVEIGPYCVVEAGARIGRGTHLIAHVCLLGPIRLGEGNAIGPFSVLGSEPAEAPPDGPAGRVELGDGNTVREGSSIERGIAPDASTRIGSRNRIGPLVAIAHDAYLADDVTLGAGARLGAFAGVEAFAQVTAGVDVHAAATIGEHSFVGGPSRVFRDVPRYLLVDGSPSKVRSINVIGLKRHGFDAAVVRALREAHRLIYRARLDPPHAARILGAHGMMTAEVTRMIESLEAQRSGRHGRARDAHRRGPSTAGAGLGRP